MEPYAQYVRANSQQVKKFEDLARYATLVLPKGPLGEVVTEGSYSVLGLVGLINDVIIHGKTKRAGEAWSFAGSEKSIQIRVTVVRSIITFLAYCEALMEVAASKWASPEFRDRLVVSIEIVKAVCRLLLLQWFPRECIYAGGKFESAAPPTPLPGDAQQQPQPQDQQSLVPAAAVAPPPTPGSTASPAPEWRGRRSGVQLRVSSSGQKYLNHEASARNSASSSTSELLKQETFMRVVAEWLHIMRPVVFSVFSRRIRNESASFFLSLAMDLASLRLFFTAAKLKGLPPLLPGANLSHDAAEFRRRCFLLLFYLFRSPAYEKSLGAFSSSLVETFKSVPGLGMVAELIAFQFEFYHVTHFYSAAS